MKTEMSTRENKKNKKNTQRDEGWKHIAKCMKFNPNKKSHIITAKYIKSCRDTFTGKCQF